MKNSVKTQSTKNVVTNVVTENEILNSVSKKVRLTLEQRKEALNSKENKSTYDYILLANAIDKIENKTASKVYKNCKENSEITNILGSKKIPTFSEFIAKLPIKASYSNWDGFKCFGTFNVKNAIAKKVASQNKKEAKK